MRVLLPVSDRRKQSVGIFDQRSKRSDEIPSKISPLYLLIENFILSVEATPPVC